jgi:hypothetical protein
MTLAWQQDDPQNCTIISTASALRTPNTVGSSIYCCSCCGGQHFLGVSVLRTRYLVYKNYAIWTPFYLCLRRSLNDRRFESRNGLGIFLFTTASRPALGPTQPPIQWVPGSVSLGIKWPRREADHSPQCSADVKNAWNYTSSLQYAFMSWCSVKEQGQLRMFLMSETNSAVRQQLTVRLFVYFEHCHGC